MYRDDELPKLRYDRMVAWRDDEFIIANGFRLVYSCTPNGIMVHLPGGKQFHSKTIPLDKLKEICGFENVQMPKRLR